MEAGQVPHLSADSRPGFKLFVLQGMTGHDMGFIARAALPFFGIMIVAVAVLVAVPDIATFLPGAMSARP